MNTSSGTRRPGIRKANLPQQRADKPKTVIPMTGGLQKLIAMNDRALKIMANR